MHGGLRFLRIYKEKKCLDLVDLGIRIGKSLLSHTIPCLAK
jgi:hypothetical protein